MVKKVIIKCLDVGVISLIADNKLVSVVQCIPKKGGMIVVLNAKNELVATLPITEWRVCMDNHKLNSWTKNHYFPMPFIDQIFGRLAGKGWYCFLDGYLGYNQIFIASEDQEKTIFTYQYGMFAFNQMSFRLSNVPSIFQRCMLSIFANIVEKSMDVFMNDFSIVGDSFKEMLEPFE
ncbi:hypothetical protein MTR67_051801 [Solanum verrucosum]|uniref:Reverse transcriptase domain-containing protein n=1 Tax=Solanum verrucosum TaxID=315347 RepID=A0AAF0V806_SOLVR|nr:hypothetical protein MTR67_051801 [Solanum verrucosum]